MPDYKPICLMAPAAAWLTTLGVSREAHATLMAPTTTRLRRASIIFLLLAPFATAILWTNLPEAVPTFSLIITVVNFYHAKEVLGKPRRKISDKEAQIHQGEKEENEDFKTINDMLDRMSHVELWALVALAEARINNMPMTQVQRAAMTQVLRAQNAYTRLLPHPANALDPSYTNGVMIRA
ncbi:hypothetical protein PG990_004185 [Apiospora arundinis]